MRDAKRRGRALTPLNEMDDHLRATAEAMGGGDTFGAEPLATSLALRVRGSPIRSLAGRDRRGPAVGSAGCFAGCRTALELTRLQLPASRERRGALSSRWSGSTRSPPAATPFTRGTHGAAADTWGGPAPAT